MKRELMGTFENPCMVGSKVQFSKSSFGEVVVHIYYICEFLERNVTIIMELPCLLPSTLVDQNVKSSCPEVGTENI